VLIPILYLKGISTGDFDEALTALLGKDAGGLLASTVARVKALRLTSTRTGPNLRRRAMSTFGSTVSRSGLPRRPRPLPMGHHLRNTT